MGVQVMMAGECATVPLVNRTHWLLLPPAVLPHDSQRIRLINVAAIEEIHERTKNAAQADPRKYLPHRF